MQKEPALGRALRGFLQAGAQNWPISDEATAQIMSDFYETAHSTGNAPKGLAEVQGNWLLGCAPRKG